MFLASWVDKHALNNAREPHVGLFSFAIVDLGLSACRDGHIKEWSDLPV
jgi:hypothetical protein